MLGLIGNHIYSKLLFKVIIANCRGQMINQKQFNFISRLDNAATPEARAHVFKEFEDEVCGELVYNSLLGCSSSNFSFKSNFQRANITIFTLCGG